MWIPNRRYRKYGAITVGVLLLLYAFCLPRPLFSDPYCTVLEASNGDLLGARIAEDGQWRFPVSDSLPNKFTTALIAFEDRRFYHHPGVDPWGLGRAVVQNVRSGRIVSGGSTLSMQVIRLAQHNPPRTVWRKLLEIVMATRLELGHSKAEILKLYAAHAPFGGNVVGLETAAWRYFGKSPPLLSWAEAAMLAVLPNRPGLIHPGRNRDALRTKRNRLLRRLWEQGDMDEWSYQLAIEEPLPEAPLPLPQLTPHLLDRAVTQGLIEKHGSRLRTTIDVQLQRQLNELLVHHQARLQDNQINNLAALIVDVERGDVLAYVGNAALDIEAHAGAVDIIPAPRSTGSILKPLLYARALHEGLLSPNSLLPDIPAQLEGYRPVNFNERYDGAVPAHQALSRSLNVPIIHLLQSYGLEKFHYHLQEFGLTTINQPAAHYGLPLVLGGAEGSLWDITNAYAGMGRTLRHYPDDNARYRLDDFRPLNYLWPTRYEVQRESSIRQDQPPVVGAGAVWLTFEAMQAVERPGSEGDWESFASSRRIAWKTGTSFGFRDAWAVGLDTRYAVGVWAGNADGEGRPGLVGIQAAAPVLFDIFSRLPASGAWFEAPFDDLSALPLCARSGYRPSRYCPVDTIMVPTRGTRIPKCQHHQAIWVDATGQWRGNTTCLDAKNKQQTIYFTLPPVQAHYYRRRHPNYQPLPPLHPDCGTDTELAMQLIYPKRPTEIYVPRDRNGEQSKTIFQVAHRSPSTAVHWHLDKEYLGTTRDFHSMAFAPATGPHRLTLVDEQGQRLEQYFVVLDK